MNNIPINVLEMIKLSPFGGVSCIFVKIDEEWGIKAYAYEHVRDKAFANQVEYAEQGFAPPAGECFEIGSYYCYSTRVAEILIDPNIAGYRREKVCQKYKCAIRKRVHEMFNAKLYPIDLHIGNWGFYEKKLMLIDLGMD